MSAAKTIQIFLPSGDPRGIRIAEITTRIVQAVEIPRALLPSFISMPESEQVTVSLHSGLGLDRLFSGDLDGWVPPFEPIPLTESPRTEIASRRLDWGQIRAELHAMLTVPEPITLAEACKRVGVEYKQLYLRANQEARMIAERHRQHRLKLKADREDALRARIAEVLDERLVDGHEGLSAREIRNRVVGPMKSVRNSFALIRQVRDERVN